MQAAPAECPFHGNVTGCRRVFHTPGCLLNCDGAYYDPCLCAADDPPCSDAAASFNPALCAAGRVHDARELAGDPVFLLSSMQWPAGISPGESLSAAHWEALRDALLVPRTPPAINGTYARAHAALLRALPAAEISSSAPAAYCDDLHDYWPDAPHPVGYHPTTGCSRAHTGPSPTATRGFTAWMSRNASGDVLVDPVRLRNATLAAEAFGAAHLVCDAHAYAAPGVNLNPYYVRARWKADASADPAVPRPAPSVEIGEMLRFGAPSYDPADSTLRQTDERGDLLMGHSLGLVRSWARWIPERAEDDDDDDDDDPLTSPARARAQSALDAAWPHWIAEQAAHFLHRDRTRPEACDNPAQLRCRRDSDCGGAFGSADLVCLLNFAESEDQQMGICATKGTCYQHRHCQASDTLCSGDGECVPPIIAVSSDADRPIGFQLFGATCSVNTQRLGRHQAISDFAQANGMCSFRHW
jgi:hypothetical protein